MVKPSVPFSGPGGRLGTAKALKYVEPPPDLAGKVCIVTGANSGTGYETALWFAKHGATVIMACRSPLRAEAARMQLLKSCPAAKDCLEIWSLDLSAFVSIREFAKKWSQRANGGRLDYLINNAGSMWAKKENTEDGFEMNYQSNHLSVFLLTHLLLPYLARAEHPRIVNVSSDGAYDVELDLGVMNGEDLPGPWSTWFPLGSFTKGMTLYARAKLMEIACTVELQRRLLETPTLSHITVHAVHPGWVRTGFMYQVQYGSFLSPMFYVTRFFGYTSYPFFRSSAEASLSIVWAAASGEMEKPAQGGRFWVDSVELPLPEQAQDEEWRKKLWDINTRDCGLEGVPLDEIPL